MNLNKHGKRDESKKSRNSSIELLRILLICGVIILHYVSDNGHLLKVVDHNSINFYIIVFMNTLCVCAVDTFIIISGYYCCKSVRISIRKLIQLLVEVVAVQLIISVALPLFRDETLSIGNAISNLIPRNYYVTLYISLMLLSPFINKFISILTMKQYKQWLSLLILLFLMEPTLADIMEGLSRHSIYGISTIGILGSEWGYTIVTFV